MPNANKNHDIKQAHINQNQENLQKNLALIKDNRDNAKEQHVFYKTLVEKH